MISPHLLASAFLVAQTAKNPPAIQEMWLDPWVGKIPWERKWVSTPVFLPGEFHGQEEPGGLRSIGSQRVRNDLATK